MTSRPEPAPAALALTGERTVPGIPAENYWFRRHEIAYLTLVEHCADAVVLEAGCGEGYGAKLLATTASRVIALDYDEPAMRHIASGYPELVAVRGNLCALPARDGSVDVVVNLQVIEHLWDQAGFLAECARVLRPGGRLLLSTPNRLTFSPGSATPLNPFHTRELSAIELTELLREAGFQLRSLHGVRHGPALRALDAKHGGSIIEAQLGALLGSLPGAGRLPGELLDDVQSVRAEDFVINGGDLDGCLDLVAVAVRP